MAQPTEVDVGTIVYYDSNGNPIPASGGSGSGSGSGNNSGNGAAWTAALTGLLGAVPDLLKSIFGNNANNTPQVWTNPTTGATNVNMGGSSNILMIGLLLLIAFMLFTGRQPIQPVQQPKRRR